MPNLAKYSPFQTVPLHREGIPGQLHYLIQITRPLDKCRERYRRFRAGALAKVLGIKNGRHRNMEETVTLSRDCSSNLVVALRHRASASLVEDNIWSWIIGCRLEFGRLLMLLIRQ